MKVIVMTEEALFEIVKNMMGYSAAFPGLKEEEYREITMQSVPKNSIARVVVSSGESEASRRMPSRTRKGRGLK
jgi:hypothetical protein